MRMVKDYRLKTGSISDVCHNELAGRLARLIVPHKCC